MAYLGRKGAVAPLTSADIPVGIVEGTDIAFLENASGTQNLGGTYSTERMYLNDSYTLTGDVTITGHLALGSVADSDVVITQDSTERTITGSGTLESGDLLHRGEVNLTGMTGELGSGVTLGSAVTGSPALNLGNATFPSGSILQVQMGETNLETSVGGGWKGVGLSVNITPKFASSKILITTHCQMQYNNSGIGIRIKRGSTVIRQYTDYSNYTSSGGQINTRSTYSIMDYPSTTSLVTYSIEANTYIGTHTFNESTNYSEIIAMEVVA